MPDTSAISMACAAIEAFVKAAALELQDIRLNVVSPIFVKESMAQMGLPTEGGLSRLKCTLRCSMGPCTGKPYRQGEDTTGPHLDSCHERTRFKSTKTTPLTFRWKRTHPALARRS